MIKFFRQVHDSYHTHGLADELGMGVFRMLDAADDVSKVRVVVTAERDDDGKLFVRAEKETAA